MRKTRVYPLSTKSEKETRQKLEQAAENVCALSPELSAEPSGIQMIGDVAYATLYVHKPSKSRKVTWTRVKEAVAKAYGYTPTGLIIN